MTETTETDAPPPTTRRLPGVDRARAFSEPAPPQVSRPALSDPAPTEVLTWERFADPAAPTDLLAEGCDWIPGGWIPPAPPEQPAEWGRRPALVKALSFGLISPRPGWEELAHRVNERLIRSATWTRSVRIAVCNPKGGSGKSPTAVVLGGVLARIRGGSVAIWDAADAAGTLASRTEGVAARCISDVARDPAGYALPSTVAMVASTQSSFADVLGSLREREFDGDDIRRVSEVLDRTYRISVADTANTPHSAAFEAVIERADILVVPTTLTADSINKALALLRRLQAAPTGLCSAPSSRCCAPAARKPRAWQLRCRRCSSPPESARSWTSPLTGTSPPGPPSPWPACPTTRWWPGPAWPPSPSTTFSSSERRAP